MQQSVGGFSFPFVPLSTRRSLNPCISFLVQSANHARSQRAVVTCTWDILSTIIGSDNGSPRGIDKVDYFRKSSFPTFGFMLVVNLLLMDRLKTF